MIRVNDRVEVTDLCFADLMYTSLSIGDRGKVVEEVNDNQVKVIFNTVFFNDNTLNYDAENESYLMNKDQLKLLRRR